MPFQSTQTLTAYIMSPALQEAVGWSGSSLMGLVRFGGLKLEYYKMMMICLDSFIKGTAMGYTFRDNYETLMSTMVHPQKVSGHIEQLNGLVQKRLDSYPPEISSIIDFLIATELASDKISFDDFIDRAKKKMKIDPAASRIKCIFEEGTSFGRSHPEMVTRLLSTESRTSTFDWEKAKLAGLRFSLETIDLDLTFLKKWAIHNMGLYCRKYAPELVAPLQI